jgi:hypothetical protein
VILEVLGYVIGGGLVIVGVLVYVCDLHRDPRPGFVHRRDRDR